MVLGHNVLDKPENCKHKAPMASLVLLVKKTSPSKMQRDDDFPILELDVLSQGVRYLYVDRLDEIG